jgi:putative ABC transport system permease protein
VIKNYLKTAFRVILRYRSFSILNVLGLGLGMASSILIFLWVANELSYDKFNANAQNIYRVTTSYLDIHSVLVPKPVGPSIVAVNPEVIMSTRVKATGSIFTIGNQKFDEKYGFYADTNFLRIFSFPMIAGNPLTALSTAEGVVITESTAKKYFGTTMVIGKTMVSDNNIKGDNLTVTGVLKDIPANSHLKFDFLLPEKLHEKTIDYDGSWGNFEGYTYLLTGKNFDPAVGMQKVKQQMDEVYNKNEPVKAEFFMQPLTDVHLGSNHLLGDVEGQGSESYVRIFSMVAVFILVIACINFMNLSTAMSGKRAKEVGLRKTIGASKGQLLAQFLGESVLISCMALLVGIAIAALALPFFKELTNKNISLQLLDLKIIVLLLATTLLVGLMAGAYPALVLSSFQPVKVLKGFKVLTGEKQFLRNGLVAMQFSISIILIVSTLVVYNQLQFIRLRDIGFNKENLLYIQMPRTGDLANNYQALKATLNQYPGITDYSVVNLLPTNLTTGTTDVIWPGKDPQMQVEFPHISVDENFAKTFGMQIVAGRFFAKNFQGDKNNYVVNEAALRVMKIKPAKAIGLPFTFNNNPGQIVGVLKDFNFKPIQHAVEPLVVKYTSSGGNLVIRTTPATLVNILPQVKKLFQDVYPNFPFTYGFMDEELSKLYRSEQQMGTLFNLFAVLSVIVSCLGLFGLATFNAQRRIREIGVRKVLGASVKGIVLMLSKTFMIPVLISAFIAFPVAWWLMEKWLQGFAYRVGMRWWIFAAAGGIAALIAFATVSVEAYKSAVVNPAKSLRAE